MRNSLMLPTHGKTAEVLANHLQKQLIYDLNEYITFLDKKRQSLLYTQSLLYVPKNYFNT